MVELILAVTSICIIIFIRFTSKKSKKEKLHKDKTFEAILFEKEISQESSLFYELKKRNFIDLILCEYEDLNKNSSVNKEKAENNYDFDNRKLRIFKEMIKDSKTEVEICQKLDIGRGEFLLLKNLYKN